MAGSRRKQQIGVVKAGPLVGLPPFKVIEVSGNAPKFGEPAPKRVGFKFDTSAIWYRDRRVGPEDRRKQDLGRAARKKHLSNRERE